MQTRKTILITILLFIFTGNIAQAADIKVSGGEDHTLVLTENKFVWSCGPNGGHAFDQYYYGVLGTGNDSWDYTEQTLARVHDGDMVSTSGYLEGINDISAGWLHSLALDISGFVWSWGEICLILLVNLV
jgi:alpha-tubulin suppressor-like RCC1 family protein